MELNLIFFRLYWTFGWKENYSMLQIRIISFVMPPVHDMEFWDFKMLILLKLHLFISRLLEFLFCVLSSSHSNSENDSCNFWWEYVCYGHHQYFQHLTIHSRDILMMKYLSYTIKILILFLKKFPFWGIW